MAALHDLCWDFLFSCQMICKQHIILNHVFFQYESNLKIRTHYINMRVYENVLKCARKSESWEIFNYFHIRDTIQNFPAKTWQSLYLYISIVMNW